MDAPRLFPLRFNVDVSAIVHSFLREIKVIAFWIMSAESSKGPIRRPFEHSDIGILFLDARDRLLDVIDIDPKVMQPRHITRFPADHGHADVSVADTYRVIRSNRFLFFSRPRLGPFHSEHSFVKLCLADEVFTDNGSMLNPA